MLKLFNDISAQKLIAKHETIIFKMLNAREPKDKIIQEIKFNTTSCELHDIDDWQQYVSDYLNQVLEEDEQSFVKPNRWQRINLICSKNFDDIEKDFRDAIDTECLYY